MAAWREIDPQRARAEEGRPGEGESCAVIGSAGIVPLAGNRQGAQHRRYSRSPGKPGHRDLRAVDAVDLTKPVLDCVGGGDGHLGSSSQEQRRLLPESWARELPAG